MKIDNDKTTSTVQISWQILYPAIRRTVEDTQEPDSEYSLEALPNIILGCTALEAFCNEISSIVASLLFDYCAAPLLTPKEFEDEVGLSQQACKELSEIKTNDSGNTKTRYKNLCKILNIQLPENHQDLCKLLDVRNGIVHFRACDRNVIKIADVFVFDHDHPDFYKALIGIKYRSFDLTYTGDIKQNLIDSDDVDWANRISTPTVALWSVEVVLLTILNIIENIPEGALKQKVVNSYSTISNGHQTVFNWGLSLIDEGVRLGLNR